MRTQKLMLLSIGIALLAGCASEKNSSDVTNAPPPVVEIPAGPYVPPGSGPGQGPGSSWQYGGSAPIALDSLQVMSDYTTRPMNEAQDIRINMNLLKYGGANGGTVTINYTENGIAYEGYFTSGHTESEARYNVWFMKDGKRVWHGFFEDFLGAIIVVIDDFVSLGDGGSVELASGSIWFRNFGLTYAPHPPTRCWFVSLGPYDCRSWRTKTGVDATRAVLPDYGYTRLGTFSGLNVKSAFNNQL